MRKITKGTVLIAVTLVAAAIALLGGGAASSAPVPVEMNYACALKSNGLMRYVTSLSQCKSTEDKVTIKPGPHKLCIQPDGSTRKVSNFNNCRPPARQVTIPPTSGTVYFCASNSTGVLRYVTNPSQCTATEFPVYVTPNDLTVSGSPGTAITLDPTADLPQGTACAVKVIANNVSDTDSLDPPDHPTADYNFSFTTDSAPTVTSTTPANSATGVNAGNNISVTFSEPVNASASSFTLECPSGSAQAFSVSGSGTSTITLDPTSDLPGATTCTVTVLASGISDVDTGDPPDGLAANYVFSFTTADAAPSVTTTSPADGATHVAVNTNIVVNFSESVTVSNSSFTLECPTGTSKSFSVSGSPGSSITLDPTSDLPEATVCTVTAVAANISDTDAVDPPDHPAANSSFSFATADAAPSVTTTSPADAADHVAVNMNIVVNFSEPVTATSSSFSLECPTGTPESFSVSGSPGSSITLDQTSDPPEGT